MSKRWASLLAYSGLAGVSVLWLGIFVCIQKANLDVFGRAPLSSLGADPLTARLFTATLVISALLFICFAFWIHNIAKATKGFLTVLILGNIFEAMAGILPFTGSTTVAHRYASYAWAILLAVSLLIIQKSAKGAYKKLATRCAILETVATVISLGGFITVGRALPLFQMIAAVSFHYWVIRTTQYYS